MDTLLAAISRLISLPPMELCAFRRSSALKLNLKSAALEITPLTGLTDELLIPKNWGGTIEAERQDATLDAWWAQWEADYYNGVNRAAGTITETVEEVGGAVSVWRYTNVQIHFSEPGKKSGDQTVRQSMTFTAQRRIRVS